MVRGRIGAMQRWSPAGTSSDRRPRPASLRCPPTDIASVRCVGSENGVRIVGALPRARSGWCAARHAPFGSDPLIRPLGLRRRSSAAPSVAA